MSQQYSAIAAELKATGTLDRIIIGIRDDADRDNLERFMSKQLTEQAMSNAVLAVNAASIVFGHTVLDEAISEFLRITTLTDIPYWEDAVKDKRISFAQVESLGYKNLLAQTIERHYQHLKRNSSMRKRADMLNAICRSKCRPILDAITLKFDGDKVEEIDRLRQNIVHGDLASVSIDAVDEKIKLLQQTGYYFFAILNAAFDVRLDPAAMSQELV